MSRWMVARIVGGARPATAAELAAIGGAVGLDVRLRSFVAGDPIRDAGQQRLLGRLHRRLDPALRWRTEVPLPIDADLRAWDAVISGPGWRLAVEAETVLDDIQALERRLGLKRRDGGIEHVMLLIADTPRNRRAAGAAPRAFADLRRDSRAVLRALSIGRDPAVDALVLL
jgi:hypothetical protein